ncbi:MAG: glycosyltransferase [Candidatus Omnitrophica bacterium]|nr:glycosyltransferase [Candidatus Omnitrophota bacterium]
MERNFTLILPVRDEEENIKILIEKLKKTLKDTIVIFVDDSSTDETEKIVKLFMAKDNDIILIENKGSRLASAIRTGIENASTEIVGWMDADLSMPVEIIPQMVDFLSEYDIVLGSRYIEGGKDLRESRMRILTSRLFNLLSKKILNTKTNDLTSGFVITKKEFLEELKIEGKYGEYCLSLIYQAERKGFKIKEAPYIFRERKKGKSKIGSNLFILFKNSLFYFLMVIRLKFRDLFFYRDNKF